MGVHAVEDPAVDEAGHPAGCLGLESLAELLVVLGQVAVGAGHDRVEHLRLVAARDHHPHHPPGQRRHVKGVHRAGQFGADHPLGILVAQRLGQRDDQVRGMPGDALRVGRRGQPGRQPRGDPRGPEPPGEDVAIEEVLLHELAEGGGELVLALDEHRRVRYRQAEGMAEDCRHREPVRHAADHGRLGPGLHEAEEGPVRADRGHDDEQDGHNAEEGGGPAARGGEPAGTVLLRLPLERGRPGGRRRHRWSGRRWSVHRRDRLHLQVPRQSWHGRKPPRPRQASSSHGS